MKKLLLATTLFLISAAGAQAQINVDIGLGGPEYMERRPVYVQPRPVVVERPAVIERRPYWERHPAYYHSYGRGSHHEEFDYRDREHTYYR